MDYLFVTACILAVFVVLGGIAWIAERFDEKAYIREHTE